MPLAKAVTPVPQQETEKVYTAAVLWTSDDGRDCEDVRDFSLEADARRWLTQQIVHETQTKELWHGRQQLEF